MTLTFCTAPKGPNSCHRMFSSVSGARLYTNRHQPEPVRAVPGSSELPIRLSAEVPGEYLGGEGKGGPSEHARHVAH